MKHYFLKRELFLWGGSVLAILLGFGFFDRESPLTLLASLIGVSSLLFNAKGNPVGQVLMILFSLLYGEISFSFSYYGEMITYLGMTAPMAAVALISWLRHPYKGKRSQVKIDRLSGKEQLFMWALTLVVTLLFFFLLAALHTANLFFSTLSVATSFLAVYLTFRRSSFYALAYAANDGVLILLWSLASLENKSYLSVVICFAAFLLNDCYGFFAWRKMEKYQQDSL